jgi:hypothetical protein
LYTTIALFLNYAKKGKQNNSAYLYVYGKKFETIMFSKMMSAAMSFIIFFRLTIKTQKIIGWIPSERRFEKMRNFFVKSTFCFIRAGLRVILSANAPKLDRSPYV